MKDKHFEIISNLHPHAQVAAVVMIGLFAIVFLMACAGAFDKK